MRPDLKFTFFGTVKNTLFRGNSSQIHFLLEDQREVTRRLNILNANAGFLVSPFLEGQNFKGTRVKAVMISAPEWYIEKDFEILISEAPLSKAD